MITLPKPSRGGRALGAWYCRMAADPSWIVQPKIDGIRAIWLDGRLQSREGLTLPAPPALRTVREPIDGEWCDGHFHGFDAPFSPGPLRDRLRVLARALQGIEGASPLPTLDLRNTAWADVAARFEGVVFKRLDGAYPHNRRETLEWFKVRAAWGCDPIVEGESR